LVARSIWVADSGEIAQDGFPTMHGQLMTVDDEHIYALDQWHEDRNALITA